MDEVLPLLCEIRLNDVNILITVLGKQKLHYKIKRTDLHFPENQVLKNWNQYWNF
jgi:hypothetical protein